MSFLSTPKPDEPNPPGVKPNKPEDRSVYGGRWGAGGVRPDGENAPDRPKEIDKSEGDESAQPSPTADPNIP